MFGLSEFRQTSVLRAVNPVPGRVDALRGWRVQSVACGLNPTVVLATQKLCQWKIENNRIMPCTVHTKVRPAP
jgi:hypothetical protein